MDIQQAFLEWRLHYGAAEGELESGDLALRELITPVLATLRHEALFARCELMRYSLRGYHWRVKLRLAPAGCLQTLRERLVGLLQEQRELHTLQAAASLPLAPYAQRLQSRTGNTESQLPAGHQQFIERHDDASLFERPDVYEAWTGWADRASVLLMQVKALRPGMAVERQFWRLYLLALLRGGALQAEEVHYAACFIDRQWTRFFDVDTDTAARMQALASAALGRLQDFMAGQGSAAGLASALPGPLAQLFAVQVERHVEDFAHLMRREADGRLGNHSALRLTAVLHLVHNRAGLGIDHELLFCKLMRGLWAAQLPAGRAAENESWASKNLDAYFDSQSIVI